MDHWIVALYRVLSSIFFVATVLIFAVVGLALGSILDSRGSSGLGLLGLIFGGGFGLLLATWSHGLAHVAISIDLRLKQLVEIESRRTPGGGAAAAGDGLPGGGVFESTPAAASAYAAALQLKSHEELIVEAQKLGFEVARKGHRTELKRGQEVHLVSSRPLLEARLIEEMQRRG